MFKKIAIALALTAAVLTPAHATTAGMSCLSKGVVNMQDNWSQITKTEPKVVAKIKTDLRDVLVNINNPDRDDKIRALLDTTSEATAKVLGQTSNEEIDASIDLVYNSTVRTIAFIESNAKNPSSKNIIESKKGQVTAAITQVVVAHIACAD